MARFLLALLALSAALGPCIPVHAGIMQELSSTADRSTGAKGTRAAVELVAANLEQALPQWLDPVFGRQEFSVPIQKTGRARLTTDAGESVELTALRLNALSPAATAPPGITGRILDANKGSLADFEGYDVAGAIVLMDIDSGRNWQNAAMLGARAVIYLASGPTPSPRSLFEDKYELTPIDFPRLYAPQRTTERLRRMTGRTATLTSQAFWANARSSNQWAFIPGTDPNLSDEMIIVEAFYDATAYVSGNAPGADEASGIATLMRFASSLDESPPRRSILIVASGAHAQEHAGMRELVYALTTDRDKLADQASRHADRLADINRTLDLLADFDARTDDAPQNAEDRALMREAIRAVGLDHINEVSTRLMRLRLVSGPERDNEAIRALAQKRLRYKRLTWFDSLESMPPQSRETIAELVEEAKARQRTALADARKQLDSAQDALALSELRQNRRIAASVSLHLSSHGTAVGAFERGWMYEFRDSVNRSRFFTELADALSKAAQNDSRYRNTLRPSALESWRGFLPDTPHLAGEVAALAGLPGITLATVHDARSRWGTPQDTLDNVNISNLKSQQKLVSRLLHGLASAPLPDSGGTPLDSYTTLSGRANLLRQGEVFPDQPATGTVFLAFHGNAHFFAMVDNFGTFRIPGLGNYRHVPHKAVLEGFAFDKASGLARWAVDKPMTGKPAYRIKMKRKEVGTDLVMFGCSQITFPDTLEPRTWRYMTRTKLIDARTEARPLRYWYSRLDTRDSTLGTYFLAPDVPLKLTLSDTVVERKVILLNADADAPSGHGYIAGRQTIVPEATYRAAQDMWSLMRPRINTLEQSGIVSDSIREIRRQGEKALKQAEQARSKQQWREYMNASQAALALASRVYNDVDATQKDVLAGVLFYIALFIPFAYCMERLLFGFTDIARRIAAFIVLLLLIIAAIYMVHPAFGLTYSPMVVILAFFILGLSVLVSGIIFFRFEREMIALQHRVQQVRGSGISKFSAFAAAFTLGVSNLRRRPLRTFLTCATLTILTFTVMNFTAVKSRQISGWAQFAPDAPYEGYLVKNTSWQDIPELAAEDIPRIFGTHAKGAPRAWYVTGDDTRAPVIPVHARDGKTLGRGVVGLSHTEPDVTGLDRVLSCGRWFKADEPFAVLLPASLALQLNVVPGDTVTIWGLPFTVSGCIANGGLQNTPDLDGEPITPIFYPSEAATRLSEAEAEAIEEGEDVATLTSRYRHVDGDSTIIIPYETLMSLGGGAGRLKAIAVKPSAKDTGTASPGDRIGLMIFRGSNDGTSVYFAASGMKYSGVSSIAIPLLISALIVLNTMVGSVYERKREIAVYTSVGLAPSHVAFLFVAEAMAFGVISIVSGYLLAQAAAAVLSGTPLWAGMTANYSSTAGVAAMALVMTVVLASTLYPARVAAQIAIPDVNKSWTMPEPNGDAMRVTLPFLINPLEQTSAGGFLQEYYNAHHDISHGLFCTDDMQCEMVPFEELQGRDICLTMNLQVWLAPFDFGVRQHVRLIFCPSETYKGFIRIRVHLTREAGEHRAWINANRRFINDLRKQLLVWRSLDSEASHLYGRALSVEQAGGVSA